MLKYYKSIYFNVYLLFVSISEESDINDWKAVLFLTFFQSLNFLVIYKLFGLTEYIQLTSEFGKFLMPAAFIFIGYLNYLLLFSGNKIDKISEERRNNNFKRKSFIWLGLLFYCISSIIAFFIFWIGI